VHVIARLRSLAALVVAAAWGASVWAGPAAAGQAALDVLDAAVPYTADFTLSSDRGTYRGHVWHQPGKERRDFETSGGGQAVIIRRDADVAYLLKPSARWYVGLGLQAVGVLAGGLDGWQVDMRKLRDETVAGVHATRWKAKAQGPKGGFDGDLWTNREGIVVKASGTVASAGGDGTPVEMTLSKVKLGPVDDAWFEPPSGWFGMDLRQVPADRVEQAVEGIKPLLERNAGGR
jgi:hypothetical protein